LADLPQPAKPRNLIGQFVHNASEFGLQEQIGLTAAAHAVYVCRGFSNGLLFERRGSQARSPFSGEGGVAADIRWVGRFHGITGV
jgi:hypothetical protein